MLKESIICIIIVISIIFGNYQTQNYTKDSVKEVSKVLTELRYELEKEEQEVNEDAVKEKMDTALKEWEVRHNKLAYFIEHDELEKIKTDLISMKSYIDTKEYNDSINEIDKCKYILKHIQDKYAFNLQNIF